MKENQLTVNRPALKAFRTPQKSKSKATTPCQWWGIDMSTIMIQASWGYVTLVLDWFSKKIVGYHIGYQNKTEHWLEALDMALQANFPDGVRKHNLNLVSNNSSQLTNTSKYKTYERCSILEINHVLTCYNNPKGNADTERMIRTMKEECLWFEE